MTESQLATPIKRSFLYHHAAQRLRDEIAGGEFPTGRLPTEREIATRYGVSIVTVRKACASLVREGIIFRRQGSGTFINDATNRIRPLRHRRTHLISYVSGSGTESVAGNFFHRVMSAAQAVVEVRDYSQVLSTVRAADLPMPIQKRKVDGVLFAGTYFPDDADWRDAHELARRNNEYLACIAETGLPVVAISNYTDCPLVHRVNPDNAGAVREAIQHLHQVGHRRIALVGGPMNNPVFNERIVAFREETRRLGLSTGESDIIEYSDIAYRDPDDAVRRVRQKFITDGENHPTALLVISGTPYLPLRAIKAAGLRVPEDVSMVAFSSVRRSASRLGEYVDPDEALPADMAALELPVKELGEVAAERLFDLMAGKSFDTSARTVLLPVKFLSGASVRRV